ncbi:hypothetical protein [Austwickia chelonae]|uniref:hypothetical protein n=1 Tax=Austwickia chelonae TaxID=100225 RepID=UPI0013C32E1A|nr:hypothetical protein [Austwickia chelonae]
MPDRCAHCLYQPRPRQNCRVVHTIDTRRRSAPSLSDTGEKLDYPRSRARTRPLFAPCGRR